MLDTKALAAAMAPVIREAVDKAVAAVEAPLLKRIEVLEKRAPEKGEPGQDGANGQDGRDGKDAEPVTDAQIAAAVEAYIAANPPADGRDGVDGKDGAPGEAGQKGLDGKDGADGVGLAGALVDRDGVLNLTLTNGEVKALGRVEGRDGENGERGPAGFSLDDFDVKLAEDGRTVEMSFGSGEARIVRSLAVPAMIYRGTFSEGQSYAKGDTVTWAGSLWHCNEDSVEKPGEGAKAWTLAAKRGRDGKDFAGPQQKAPEKVRI